MTTRQQPAQRAPANGPAAPAGDPPAADPRAGDPRAGDAAVGDLPAEAAGSRPPLLGWAGRALALLFPQAPAGQRSRTAAGWIALVSLVAIAVGAFVQLERQQGVPAWQSLWAEDHRIFLPQVLQSPWGSLLRPYDGYIELVPRLIAEVVARLPILDAAAGFAIAGALVSSCTAVFVFHASSGHVRRPELRILLAASVLLLPTALIELANSGVNTPWYLLYGLFWALLWRPRSRWGMLAAALMCFAASSSIVLAALYIPLAAARVIALPRVREHAATLGWLAGGLVQVPALLAGATYHQATTPGKALAFFGHNVILPTVAGHGLADLLWASFGLAGATVIATVIVAAVVAWMLIRGAPSVRVFVLAALGIGLILCLVPVFVHGDVANVQPLRNALFVKGSRYGQVPILILGSSLIVGADAFQRRTGIRFERAARVTAAVVLAAVLGINWATSYRYPNDRTSVSPWTQQVAAIRLHCQRHPGGHIRALGDAPCSVLRG
jgi:hypothetical protein